MKHGLSIQRYDQVRILNRKSLKGIIKILISAAKGSRTALSKILPPPDHDRDHTRVFFVRAIFWVTYENIR